MPYKRDGHHAGEARRLLAAFEELQGLHVADRDASSKNLARPEGWTIEMRNGRSVWPAVETVPPPLSANCPEMGYLGQCAVKFLCIKLA
jgi:hypothetical protein